MQMPNFFIAQKLLKDFFENYVVSARRRGS